MSLLPIQARKSITVLSSQCPPCIAVYVYIYIHIVSEHTYMLQQLWLFLSFFLFFFVSQWLHTSSSELLKKRWNSQSPNSISQESEALLWASMSWSESQRAGLIAKERKNRNNVVPKKQRERIDWCFFSISAMLVHLIRTVFPHHLLLRLLLGYHNNSALLIPKWESGKLIEWQPAGMHQDRVARW